MKIDSIKDLKKLIQLCRQTGVEAIEVDGVKMNLGPVPITITNKRHIVSQSKNEATPANIITEDMKIQTDGLTDEQLLYYSAQSHIDNTEQQ